MTGAYAFTLTALPPLVAALFLTALTAHSARRRNVPGALPLAAGSAFAALWLLCLAMTMMAVDAESKLFWHKFQAIWHFPTVAANLCFALEYSRPGRWLRPPLIAGLSIIALFIAFGILFFESPLFFRSLTVADSGLVTVQYATFGLILVALGAGLVSVNTLVFLRLFARMPEQRLPVTLMLTADLASRSLYVLGIYRSANNAYASTLTVLALCLTWSIYAIVVFGFRILDPLGAARLTVLRQMREGMIVFDNDWRVVSVNRAAEGVLGAPASQLRGRNWQRVLPDVRPPAAPAEEMPVGEVWLPALVANRDKARCYALNLSPLYDQRELRAGSLLLLLDITAQRRAQAQAQEQQRTLAVLSERERLARELHDDLAQVLAFVNAQGQATRLLLNQGDVQAAHEHLARLIEVAQEADADLREAILGLRVPLPDAGFLPALRAYLRQYEKRFGISTELVTPAPISDQAFDPLTEAQLLRIIQEALTNARKHAHARAVKVTISAHDGLARLVIMDDGSGFRPADEAANGCDHVGLRVMRERAEEVGGSLEVRSTVGRGTEVIVTAPARLSRAGGPEGGHGAVAAC